MKLKKEFFSFFLLTISCTLIRSSGFELRKTKNEKESVNKSDFENVKNSNNRVIQNDFSVSQSPVEVNIEYIQNEGPCSGMMSFLTIIVH